jgi:hypothetical protein
MTERMITISGVKNIPEMIFAITCRASVVFITKKTIRTLGGQVNDSCRACSRGLHSRLLQASSPKGTG